MKTVAVVGGGIAGLSAARWLVDRGHRVCLFDKGRGPGGRATTRRRDRRQFDHGAQYFTVRDSRFGREVEGWSAAGIVAPWRPRLAVVDSSGTRTKDRTVERLVGVPGMDALAKSMAAGLDVNSGALVASLTRRGATWTARGDDGEPLSESDAVLLAIPPAQALALIPHDLPFARLIDAGRLAPTWAVLAAFEPEIELDFDAAFVNTGPLRWVADDASKPGRSGRAAWVLHATPEWSAAHLERERAEIARELLDAFAVVAGRSIPEPAFVDAHRWRYAIPSDRVAAGPWWDPASRIGVCGDWCRSEGRIEGAYTSGLEIADAIAKSL